MSTALNDAFQSVEQLNKDLANKAEIARLEGKLGAETARLAGKI